MVHRHTEPVYIPYAGPTLLGMSLLNKGTAFSEAERQEFNLNGLIPHCFETLDEQARRAYLQYCNFKDPLNKHIYLRGIQDSNETLFYRLVQDHIDEMLPIIYTPTVGDACERFSEIFRRTRGLFISYPNRHRIDELLHNATKKHVKVIVVTDGSRILGLGDLGVGGMGIPIGKLSIYSACGGISPAYTLPIMLDVGTNNESLRKNPMYVGWRHERIDGQEYDEFMELFIEAVKKRWPHVMLQFEDFQQSKALKLLNTYRDQLCCFNDDIQGTAAVTVGSLMAACRSRKSRLSDQHIVIAGAGSAGCGIAEQIVMQMRAQGLSEVEARNRIWMIDREGLLTRDTPNLYEFQHRLAQPASQFEFWEIAGIYPSLREVVEYVRPTILIGASGQPGLFDRELITTMLQGCDAPIIFPLSNPSKNIEAVPADLIEWTQGNALVATGSPFADVQYNGQTYPIAQCNNSYIFPGIGLAAVAGKIDFITDQMLVVASEVLAKASPMAKKPSDKHLLPPLSAVHSVSKEIALQVALQAQEQGLAQRISEEKLKKEIEDNFWLPEYRHYKRVSV